MGKIEDDLRNGAACSWCGIYFKDEHGYPVLCSKCYQEALKNYTKKSLLEELGLQEASLKEMK